LTDATIRPARRGDAGEILRLLSALSEQDGAEHPATAEDYQRHGFGPDRLFQSILAESAGEIVGVAVFFPTYSTQRGRPGVFVQDLYIVPEMRGHGLGRRLLAAVRAQAAAWGAEHLLLMVAGGNRAARDFYDRIGFRRMARYAPLLLDGAALDALMEPP
jgi:GNAT superfamily N-acetyltransferase